MATKTVIPARAMASRPPAPRPGPAVATRYPVAGADLSAVPTFGVPLVQRCGGMPEPCPCHDDEPAPVRRMPAGPGAVANPGSAGVDRLIRESVAAAGTPLAPALRGELESGLGADLSPVRLHTGAAAVAAAARLGARAYTVGEHIVLGPGAGDRRTLTHEVAHVLQQRGRPPGADPAAAGQFRLGEPGDRWEREADRAADSLEARPPPTVSAPHDPDERAAGERAGRALVRLGAEPDPSPTAGAAVPAGFGRAFDHDFSGVRLHADAGAARLTAGLDARAVTIGRQIYFGPGQYRPGSEAGQRLLAHELAHVVQHDEDPRPRIRRAAFSCTDLIRDPGPARLLSGTAVHRLIQTDFLRKVPKPGGRVEMRIPGAAAHPLRTEGLCGAPEIFLPSEEFGGVHADFGSVDLAYLDRTGELSIAEIKPAVLICLVDGEKQLARYIEQGNADDVPQRAWRSAERVGVVSPMPERRYPGRTFTLGNIEIRTAWCGPGLLGYAVHLRRRRRRPSKELRKEAVTQPAPSLAASEAAELPQAPREPGPAPEPREAPGPEATPTPREAPGPETAPQPRQAPGPEATPAPVETPGRERQPEPAGGSTDPSLIPALLTAAALLSAAARRQGLQAAERAAVEAAYKRILAEAARRGAVATAERLMINGVKLGSAALEKAFQTGAQQALERDLAQLTAKQAERLLAREAGVLIEREAVQAGRAVGTAVARRLAANTLTKVVPFLSVVIVASQALAAADHASKGGTIELGLTGSDVDLSGSTKLKQPANAPKSDAVVTGKLTDTTVDVETTGIPSLGGSAEIDARKVTVTGTARGLGTPVTVQFTAKLTNTTIVIKRAGVLTPHGVAVIDLTATDATIEIDLPDQALAAPPSAEPVVIPPGRLKITQSGGPGAATAAGVKAGSGSPGPGPGTGAAGRAGDWLSGPVRARLRAAGPAAEALVDALLAVGGTGLKADDTVVEALLRVLTDQRVTAAEMDRLRARIAAVRAPTLDALLKSLSTAIGAIRAGATPPPLSPGDPRFRTITPGQARIAYEGRPAVGATLTDVAMLGRDRRGTIFEATITLTVLSVGPDSFRVRIIASSPLNTPLGAGPSPLVNALADVEPLRRAR